MKNCDQKLETKKRLVLYKEKNRKMPIKSVKMKISKNKKMRFFLMSQGSFNPKIRFLDQKVCPVARPQTHRHTHRQTDTQSDYWGHPFRVSGFFPSTYHQGSAQLHLAPIFFSLKKVTHIIGKIHTGYLWSQIFDIGVIMISYVKTNDAITIKYKYAKFSKWPLPPSWIPTYLP